MLELPYIFMNTYIVSVDYILIMHQGERGIFLIYHTS
jgi:hypothetical protein